MRDCAALEELRIPTVHINARAFVPLSQARAKSLGYPGLRRVVFETLLTDQTPADVARMTEERVDQVVAALTAPVDAAVGIEASHEEVLCFEGPDLIESFDAMNREFLALGWSDGLPLVPATRRKVEAMLAGLGHWDERIAVLAPAMGEATLGKVAVNAVMAGCRPVHMSIVLAAVKALAHPSLRLGELGTATNPDAPLLIVNGPIRRKAGINSGGGALGPGAPSYANTVIGRAIRLIMMNVGGSYVGKTDMDTIGSPIKYSLCLGENEEESPWEPLHVSRGFAPETSTVTVAGVQSLIHVSNAITDKPDDILTSYAYTANSAGATATRFTKYTSLGKKSFCILPPDHARVLGRNGWSKRDVSRFLYDNAVLPARIVRLHASNHLPPGREDILTLADDAPIPCYQGADDFEVIVAGASVGKGAFATGATMWATEEIVDRDFQQER